MMSPAQAVDAILSQISVKYRPLQMRIDFSEKKHYSLNGEERHHLRRFKHTLLAGELIPLVQTHF